MSLNEMCVAAPSTERTTNSVLSDTYERLVSAHAALNRIVTCCFGEESEDHAQPVGVGIHASAVENDRLAALLQERLDRLYNRL